MAKENHKCPTCGHITKTWEYRFDIIDALLLLAMAQEVKRRVEKTTFLGQCKDFTAANQVHVPTLEGSLAMKCRTTQMSKLGLVAKLKVEKKHRPGIWVITDRGWSALRGEPVPAAVTVREGEIYERIDERITLSEAFKVHREAAENAARRNRPLTRDYRNEIVGWVPEEWYRLVPPPEALQEAGAVTPRLL
jgi:hypothetical protein